MTPDPRDAIQLSGHGLEGRTFILGNGGGFVLYLPVELNVRERTLVPIKWFGASEFGRKYVEVSRSWLLAGGEPVALDRTHQTGFSQYLDRAERTFTAGGRTVRQTYAVPAGIRAFLLTLDAGPGAGFAVEPEFDMRYYQAFNTDFSGYAASAHQGLLTVGNRIAGPATVEYLEFHALVRAVEGEARISLLPEEGRLHPKTYLKDEARERLIRSAYALTHEEVPDEAPIWDTYDTELYVPARIESSAPVTLVFAFGGSTEDAQAALDAATHPAPLQRRKRETVERLLEGGNLVTGDAEADTAYRAILARFNEALVARNVTIHAGERDIAHFSGIFAGNKYFLDAWKRDENISLIGPLLTNDETTVRSTLVETWQFQDPRTGRLPQIIRLGEPLVYYSSDGTLWALRRLSQYTRMTGDESLLAEKYGMVERFFSASLDFVQRGLLPSGGIIDRSYLWETWEDTPYTPRNGFPVEIELLWLTALREYEPAVRVRNPHLADRLTAVRAEGEQTFGLFQLDGYLADSLDPSFEPRPLLTPNGYIAFDLDVPLSADLQRSMVALARDQLAGRVGVKSLARRDWERVLSPEFLSAPRSVVNGQMASVGLYNYHRGVEWLWLNQFMVKVELACGDPSIAYDTYVAGQVHSALREGGVGGLSELYDTRGPLGADFQAWSMTGFVACLHAFTGIEVDAIAKRVRACPVVPDRWSGLECRRQIGGSRFDLSYRKENGGEQTLEVRWVDPRPTDTALSLGVRVPQANAVETRLNNQPVAARRCSTAVPGTDEVWVDVPPDGSATQEVKLTVAASSQTGHGSPPD